MDFKTILKELGVHEGLLNAEEKAKLDHDGFCILRDVFSPSYIKELQEFIDKYIVEHHPTCDEPGCQRLYHLIDKSPLFDLCWSHPRFLAAANYIVKEEFRPMSINYRTALPGGGNQELHSDRTWTADGRFFYGQAIVALVDMTKDNGPTRLVPGTHLTRKTPADEMKDTKARHPKQVDVVMPAGSAIFFNGCLWHSGTQNNSKQHRPVMHCGFALRHCDHAGTEAQRGTITREMYNRLSPVQRNFLDLKVSNTLANTDLHSF